MMRKHPLICIFSMVGIVLVGCKLGHNIKKEKIKNNLVIHKMHVKAPLAGDYKKLKVFATDPAFKSSVEAYSKLNEAVNLLYLGKKRGC